MLVVVGLIVLMWILETVNWLFGGPFYEYAIRPWSPGDIGHIFTAPFLHWGFGHLVANTLPMLILGSLVAFSGLSRFAATSLIVIIVSGLGVWLFTPPGAQVAGASGLIFGYFGFLVLRGIIERKTVDIVIMICVVIFYGSMIFGVLPQTQGVSWQAHLFGFIGGLIAAVMVPTRQKRLPSAPNPGYGIGGYGGGSGGDWPQRGNYYPGRY